MPNEVDYFSIFVLCVCFFSLFLSVFVVVVFIVKVAFYINNKIHFMRLSVLLSPSTIYISLLFFLFSFIPYTLAVFLCLTVGFCLNIKSIFSS